MENKHNSHWKTDTLCVHAGEGTDTDTRAIRRPIHMANSFELPGDPTELLKTFSFEEENLDKFQYTREHSPTPRSLEERLAILEGGEDCVVTASGMGAIAATFFTLLNSSDHIVASEVCYTGAQKLLSFHMPRFGVDVTLVDTTDLAKVKDSIRGDTKMVYIETPANPLVEICDIEELTKMAHSVGALVVVDSTWSGLINQSPLALGADAVIHSATKYINGHGDCLGGAVISNYKITSQIREYGIVHLGACISPFNAWLMLRGSVTLPLRVKKHSENAQKVAEFLESHEKVKSVRYPGLKSHPGYEIAKKQMKAPSGMLNFNLNAGMTEHFKLLKKLKLIAYATSLGHDQSLIIYMPTSFFFDDFVQFNDDQEEQKKKYKGIMGDGVFRFSVGIENADDIIEDLAQALNGVP